MNERILRPAGIVLIVILGAMAIGVIGASDKQVYDLQTMQDVCQQSVRLNSGYVGLECKQNIDYVQTRYSVEVINNNGQFTAEQTQP